MSPQRAVILLSGGLDSATVLALAVRRFDVYALTVNYGQRHHLELDSARAIAAHYSTRISPRGGLMEHREIAMDLFGGSALMSPHPLPHHPSTNTPAIPCTYVPARNTILLSLALGWAEVLGAKAIFIGANAVDYSGYPDCRPEFIEAYQQVVRLGTKAGVETNTAPVIHAPLIDLPKAAIILMGQSMHVDYSLTTSCYDPTKEGACGVCDACRIRLEGFSRAGIKDPVHYRSEKR